MYQPIIDLRQDKQAIQCPTLGQSLNAPQVSMLVNSIKLIISRDSKNVLIKA